MSAGNVSGHGGTPSGPGSYSRHVSLEAYRALVGQEVGVSEWFLVDQQRIDAFAEVTRDFQFIHVDPLRARESPFGGTVAHGFLTLSLLVPLSYEVVPGVEGAKATVNYGANNVRFVTPVRSGKRIRARFVLKSFTERSPGSFLATFDVTMQIEGETKPALVLEWLALTFV